MTSLNLSTKLIPEIGTPSNRLPTYIPEVGTVKPARTAAVSLEHSKLEPFHSFSHGDFATQRSQEPPMSKANADHIILDYKKGKVAATLYSGVEPSENDVAVEIDRLIKHSNIEWKLGFVFDRETRLISGVVTKFYATLEEVLPKQLEYWFTSQYFLTRATLGVVGLFSPTSRDTMIQQNIEMEQTAWIQQLMEALCYLHVRNYVHRDVNPKCCLIDEQSRVLKLADFGSPRKTEELDMPFFRVGSPVYLALEVLQYERFSYQSDVYSFAMTILFIVTNHHPFDGEKWRTMTLNDVCADITNVNSIRFKRIYYAKSSHLFKTISDDPSERPEMRQLARQLSGANTVKVVQEILV